MNMRDDRLAIRESSPAMSVRPKMAVHDLEMVSALRGVPALQALPQAVMTRLATGAIRLDLIRGESLFGAEAHCAGLYVVASGRIMLSVGSAEAGHKVIRLAEAGDILGLSATLLGLDTFASAEALVDSTVVLLTRETLLDRAARDVSLALALANIGARQSRNLAIDLESVSLQSGRERIVNYLLANAATGPAGPLTVLLSAKKSIIASRLSVTPEYFSRTLHELISAGAIAVNGRQIVILDAVCLRHSDHAA